MMQKKHFCLGFFLLFMLQAFAQKNECLVKKMMFFDSNAIKDTTKNYANDTSYYKSIEFFYENKQIKYCIIKRKRTYPMEPKAEEKIIFVRNKNVITAISDKDTLGIWVYNNKNELIQFERKDFYEGKVVWDIQYKKNEIFIKNKYSKNKSLIKALFKDNEIQIIGRAISNGEDDMIGEDPQRQAATLDNNKNPFYFQKELVILASTTHLVDFLSNKNIVENYLMYATAGDIHHNKYAYEYNKNGFPTSRTFYGYYNLKYALGERTYFEYVCE